MSGKGLNIRKASLTSRQLAKRIAELALDKKAEDIVVLDMRKRVNFCDYFVICSGTSVRHAQAVASGIEEGLQEDGLKAKLSQRMGQSWIVYDLGDVVVHVFEKNVREFYNLEYLWREAKTIKWES